MQSKTLLVALSLAAFSSCSTAYKTVQTPDDVYYSPARVVEERQRQESNELRNETAVDYEISMGIRDSRWRYFRDDYDYQNSPYNYATCKSANYGYYYNPYYYPWAIYTGRVTYSPPVNSTPRMVNLNAYTGYNTKIASGKTAGTVAWSNQSTQYNNSNRSSTRSEQRQIIRSNNNSSSVTPSNNSRTYSPSSGSSGSGSSSSGSGGSGSSVARPGRGG